MPEVTGVPTGGRRRGVHGHYLPSHRCSVFCPSLAIAGWSTARSPSGPSVRIGMATYAGREGVKERKDVRVRWRQACRKVRRQPREGPPSLTRKASSDAAFSSPSSTFRWRSLTLSMVVVRFVFAGGFLCEVRVWVWVMEREVKRMMMMLASKCTHAWPLGLATAGTSGNPRDARDLPKRCVQCVCLLCVGWA